MNNLKKYRKEFGFTQQEVANHIGVSRETYNRYETGKAYPGLIEADALAEVLWTNVYELFPDLRSKKDYDYMMRVNKDAGYTEAIDVMFCFS